MNLYFFDQFNPKGKHTKSSDLTKRAIRDFILERNSFSNLDCSACVDCFKPNIDFAGAEAFDKSINLDSICGIDSIEILYTKHGKPYVDIDEVEFSVSHSEELWVCAISKHSVGIDIQKMRDVDFERLSERFFTKEEAHYVRLWGIDGFFDIWSRKEAYVKYRGTGFSNESFATFSVLDANGDLAATIGEGDSLACFTDLYIADDIRCIICSDEIIKSTTELNIKDMGNIIYL